METLRRQAELDNRPPSGARAEELRQALIAFDTTASNERFAQIAALRGFDITHTVLAELLIHRSAPPESDADSIPEELPPPAPQG